MKIIKLNKNKNGVCVIVYKHYKDNNIVCSVVEADCKCLGYKNKLHSNPYCINI